MKLLNGAVAVFVVGVLIVALRRPVGPPDDLWFQQAVLERSGTVLVKFGAEWCPPCRQMDQVLDHAGSNLPVAQVVRINIDEKPELAAHYGVSSIPRLMLFRNGELIARSGGFANAESLQGWITSQTH